MREPRMRAQPLHRAAVRRDATVHVERAEPAQESRALASVAAGGASSQRSSSAGVPQAARSSASGTRSAYSDLGGRIGCEGALRALAPQSIADARGRAAGAARALLGGRARDALRLESAHAGHGIEHAAPLEARSRRRRARRRSSGSSRRCWSRARPCGGRRAPARAPHPAGRERARRRAAARRRRRRAPLEEARSTRRISPAPGRNTSTSPVARAARAATARADARVDGLGPGPGNEGRPLPT